jgi:hypothetical protein
LSKSLWRQLGSWAPAIAELGRGIGGFLAEVMIKIIVHDVLRGYALEPTDAYAPSVSMPILHPENPMPVRVAALGT